jgi:CRP-like cAMP-binding protein
MAAKATESVENQLLLSLPNNELSRLAQKLEPVELAFRQILSPAEKTAEHVYFPQRGMVSLVKPMQDGALVEVGLVGREGFVGVAAVLGSDTFPGPTITPAPMATIRRSGPRAHLTRCCAIPTRPKDSCAIFPAIPMKVR